VPRRPVLTTGIACGRRRLSANLSGMNTQPRSDNLARKP
jgi:hypothetical protein